MTKRIISLILAAAMLFSFPAFAEDAEVVKPDSGNMLFAKAMEIVPADAVGTNIVTRGYLAKMFCAVMRTDVGLAPSTNIEFTDVPAELSTVVAHVASMGIMNGVGGGLFAPDAPVTYVQALKAMVTFLGYADYAEAKNGYPFGYYMQAMELDLISNPPKDMNTELTLEKAVSLFKRAINADYRAPVEFDPEVKYEITKNLTYLHYHRDIVRVRGIVKSTAVSDISDMGTTAHNKIRLGSNVFSFDTSKFNAHKFFGHNVDAYVQVETEEILYIEDVGTTVTELSSVQLSGLVGDNIEYFNDAGKKKKLEINASTKVLYNGTNCTNYTEHDINPFPGSSLDGGLTAIDNDGNGVYDIICVEAYETFIVNKIIGNKIYAENTVGEILDLENEANYVEGESFLVYNILGEPVKVSDIKEGSTVSVSEDKYGNITSVVVTIDNVIGILTATQMHNGRLYVTVNGESFECSNLVMNDPETANLELGVKVCLSFNKGALVSDIEQELYNIWNSGYITACGTVDGVDPKWQVKLFGEDGNWHIYDLAEEIYINESSTVSPAANFATVAGNDTDGLIKRQPILYKINTDEQIKEVIFAEIATDGTYNSVKQTSPFYMMKAMNGARTAEVFADGTNLLYWSHKDAGFEGTAFMSKQTVVFAVPPVENRGDEAKYSIADPFDYDDWESAAQIALYAKDPQAVVDVAVKMATAAEINAKTYSFVVEKVDKYIDADTGMDYYRLTGYSNGKQYVYTDPDNKLAGIGPNGTHPDKGDIIRVVVNGYDEITNANFHFDASAKAVYKLDGTKSAGGVSDDTYRNNRFVYGTVTYCDDEIMTVGSTATDGATAVEIPYTVASHRYTKVIKDGRGNISIQPATVADVLGSDKYGADASKVVVHTQSARAWGVVIYEGF
ncbi:MAG: S-layer homology domain-containing protein [Clostridia bacterium]|nr:S-layer homology domain-containing protein [Clostridia bacterium]